VLFAKSAFVAAVLATLALGAVLFSALRDLPIDTAIVGRPEREILLQTASGAPLGRVGPLKISNASRAEFPKRVVDAVLSIEDRHFYHHWGVDVVAILRAARRNYSAGTIMEGGSTITQQLVKLRMLGGERTLSRKIREALAAISLEMHLTKDEILTDYLNSVYMGAGAQGFPAAARLYFDKRLQDVTLPEAALLAGLIKAPSRYNPLRNLPAARERAEVVLDAMVDNGAIDKRTAQEAKAHPAVLARPALESEATTWFSDWVSQEAQEVTGSLPGTIHATTTLVPELQTIAQQAVNDALAKNARLHVSQGALVAMRPDGAVVAMVGGRDYRESQFNRAVQAQRQPGSAFKLFVYLAAVREGLGPNDTISAAPVDVGNWSPDNYGDRQYGTVTLADAFAHSINTAAVRLSRKVGMERVIKAARDLGIDSPLPNVPSLALGTADVSLIDMTAAYAAILAGHAPVRPWGITSFASGDHPRLMSIGPPLGPQRPLGVAQDKMIALLKLPIERGTARNAALDQPAAGKTGTAQDYRDAWFIGFTDSLVVGVWVGNDDRTPMKHVTGGSIPASIWKSFMTQAAPILAAENGVPEELRQAQKQQGNQHPEPPRGNVADRGDGSEQAQCNYRACGAKYQSFDPADCTYLPYGGRSRRRCQISADAVRQAAAASTPVSEGQVAAGRCNVDICAMAYSSFRASDCTYQPFDGGPRRMCQR
jgi:1A family penicillin-binding protein